MNDPNTDFLVDRYLAGRTTPEDERVLHEAVRGNPDLVRMIYEQCLLEQDLKALFMSRESVRSRPDHGRSRRLYPVLAAAAAVLVAAGIGFLFLRDVSPRPIMTVAGLRENARAFIVRNNRTVAAAVGDPLYAGDVIRLKGAGRATVENTRENVKLVLTHWGRLQVLDGLRYSLQNGRLEASCASREGKEPLQFTASLSRLDVVGTEFVLKSVPVYSTVRTIKGRVRFHDIRNESSVTVASGECAMIHEDNEKIYKDTYSPGKIIEGRVMFSDDFEQGIDRWTSCVFDEYRNDSPIPPDVKPRMSWVKTERDGKVTGCMEILGMGKLPKGRVTVAPRSLTQTRQFVCEMDIFYFTKPHATSLSFLAHYWDQPPGKSGLNYRNPKIDQLFTQMARDKRWGHIRILHMDADDPNGVCTALTHVTLDGTTLDLMYIAEMLPPLIGFKPKEGRAQIDNFVVKEVISFE
jgi:hypothetical protein